MKRIPGTFVPICTACEDEPATPGVVIAEIGPACAECAAIAGVIVSLMAQQGFTRCAPKPRREANS